MVTIRWTDSESAGPYMVAYKCVSGKAKQGFFWAGGTKTTATTDQTEYTFTSLAPNSRYSITVYDVNHESVTARITVPAASSFQGDGINPSKVKISIAPKYKQKSTYFSVKTFKAATMEEYLRKQTRACGIRYEVTVPQNGKDVSYFVQLVFRAPNGYTFVETALQEEYQVAAGEKTSVWKCIGTSFFKGLYDNNGAIPTGTYKVELYWDGMLVNKSTFSVQ